MGRRRWARIALVVGVLAVVAAIGGPPSANATSAPDAGIAFEPPRLPEPRFGIKPPSADPRQVRIVPAADGVALYTQTWLPAPLNGHTPPVRVPVVVQFTPYATTFAPDDPSLIELLVSRGYAVTFANVRGSGGSGGCFGMHDQHDVDDGARVIDDAGRLAPWSSGVVGMSGASSPGGTQLAVATGPDRARLEPLKALVVGAPAASAYEFWNHNGVPHFIAAPGNVLVYLAALTNPTDGLEHITERFGCQFEQLASADALSGNWGDFWAARDHTLHLDRLEAATFMYHGTADRRVSPNVQAGLFDAIPDSTPRAGLFGVWDHEIPDEIAPVASPRADWERADFKAMVFAWFERHLRGVDNGVDAWPVVQAQGTDGQWRTASEWPSVPGPRRSFALGPNGVLGVMGPSGSTSYLEVPTSEVELPGLPSDLPGTTAVFTTAPLEERVELVGRPSVDLWVQLVVPDSHLTVRLEVVDAQGQRLIPEARTVGARSALHLEPLVNGNRFRQRAPSPPPTNQPVLVTIPLDPIDLVAPPGSRLRLSVAGNTITWDGLDGVSPGLGAVFQGPLMPSGVVQQVTILHDAAHPSALHYTTPEASSVLLDVREPDQVGELGRQASAPTPAAVAAPSSGATLPATGTDRSSLLPTLVLGAGVALAMLARTLSGAGRRGCRLSRTARCASSR